MKHRHSLQSLDHGRIVAAIAAAEKKTSGQVRVYVSRKSPADAAAALALTRARFAHLKMHETRDRNAVLLMLAPRARKFAVVGDAGVHAKCGVDFWRDVGAGMTERLRGGDFTDAIIWAVGEIGSVLAAHFPARGPGEDAGNELSDEVVGD